MAQLPMICDTCGRASRFPWDMQGMVAIGGEMSGPCPYRDCGGRARVPKGAYELGRETIRILSAPERTFEEFQRLVNIADRAQRLELSTEEVAAAIEQELPRLSNLRSFLPRTRGELYAFLALLVAIITPVCAHRDRMPAQPTPRQERVLVEEAKKQMEGKTPAEIIDSVRRALYEQSRITVRQPAMAPSGPP